MVFFGATVVALLVVIITIILYALRKVVLEEGGPLEYKKDVKLTGKTVLITGANCGLGKGAALDLAARGARVVLACRNKEKAEAAAEEIKKETGNEDVSIVMLDLSDFDSVRAAAEYINKTYNRLDVLINNAAVGLADPIPTMQGFDMTFGTNHLGHFLFTHLLLDLLKKSAPSRIVNVSSKSLYAVWENFNYDAGLINEGVRYPHLQGYPISKLANFYHARALSDHLKGTGVTINAVHPGYVQTEIMKRDLKDTKKAFFNKVFLFFSKFLARSVKDGCQTLVHAAVEPELENVTGEYLSNMMVTTDQLPSRVKNIEQARKLVEFSCVVCEVPSIFPEDLVAAKDETNDKTDDKKDEDRKDDDGTKDDEVKKDQKESDIQIKTASAVFATGLAADTVEIIDSVSNKKLEDTDITAVLDNDSREISPVKCEITPIPSTIGSGEISESVVDDEI